MFRHILHELVYGSETGAQADNVHSDHVPAECGAGHSVVGVVLDRQEGRASQSRSHHHHHPRPDHPHHRNCQQVRRFDTIKSIPSLCYLINCEDGFQVFPIR